MNQIRWLYCTSGWNSVLNKPLFYPGHSLLIEGRGFCSVSTLAWILFVAELILVQELLDLNSLPSIRKQFSLFEGQFGEKRFLDWIFYFLPITIKDYSNYLPFLVCFLRWKVELLSMQTLQIVSKGIIWNINFFIHWNLLFGFFWGNGSINCNRICFPCSKLRIWRF